MLLRLLLCGWLLLCPALVLATDWGKVGGGELPVNLEADTLTFDKQSGRYKASGNVHLQQGEVELRSKVLWWNQASGEVEAEGEVELTSPDEKLTGSKVFYHLDQGTGRVDDGYVFLREKNMHVKGQRLERLGEKRYRITDGTFTTCDGEVPSWKFGAKELDVTIGGFAKAKHAVFYLKDLPSFYLPYLLYPVSTERESGFLIPRAGYSSRRGYEVGNAYYWVISRNQDATFYLDYLSELGVGTGAEYRYIFGRGSTQNAGEARVYHIDVKDAESSYALDWQHDGRLPGAIRAVVDAEYVSDREYFKDFGEVAEEYNKDKVESVFFLSRAWRNFNLIAELKYTKDLEIDDPTTLQRLPRISLDGSRQRIASSPFFYTLKTEYTNFWREEGLRGQRMIVRPGLSVSGKLWDVLEVTPEIAYTDRYYWGLNDGRDAQQEGIVEFSTKVNTRLQRVYAQPIDAIDRLRHTLEPEIKYLYTPGDRQDHLPSFDSADRVAEANRFEYALVQRLTARFDHEDGESSYRDLLYLRLSQAYILREEFAEQPFQPIRAQLTLLPTSWSSLDIDTTFDVDQGEWSKFSAEVAAHDQRENSVKVLYRTNRDEEINYATLDLTLGLLKPVYLGYGKRYDFAVNRNLEDVIKLEYRHQCWSALLQYRDNTNDESIMLTFTMQGIGTVGSIGGGMRR